MLISYREQVNITNKSLAKQQHLTVENFSKLGI